jgi:aminoglycoside 6'-N-acetyltransferase I
VAATPNVFDTGSPEEFIKFLEEGGTPSAYVEYDRDNNAVGYLALCALNGSDAIEVRSIAVVPQHQHAGFGKMMMREAERIALEAGRNRVILVTSPANTRAVKFYSALGYTVRDTIHDYYGDGTPRHILEKEL